MNPRYADMTSKNTTTAILFFICFLAKANDTMSIHFLYGSKPKKAYAAIEKEWFGGKLGGHVGIEKNDEGILHFLPSGDFHIVNQSKNPKSRFLKSSKVAFYQIFGGQMSEMKTLVIKFSISKAQVSIYDSLSKSYLSETPYDYAFKGMRCASAAYDILDVLGIVDSKTQNQTSRGNFYPRVFRKKMLELACQNHWQVVKTQGTSRRKWDRD